jgi:hypothetical protein
VIEINIPGKGRQIDKRERVESKVWVTVPVTRVALEVVHSVEESYRILAPKRLVALLDE